MPVLLRFLIAVGLLTGLAPVRAADTLRLYFPTAQSQINPAIRKTLDSALYYNAIRPDRALTIVGYADFRGSTPYNQQLSQARANTIRDYLLQNKFSTRRLMEVTAKGELPATRPEAVDGIADHRRVDLISGSILAAERQSLPGPTPNNPAKPDVKNSIPEQLATTAVGKTFQLAKLYFPPGRHVIYEQSASELDALAAALQAAPALRIRIEGHVCCIDTTKVKDALDEQTQEYRLSENRAIFIAGYLKKKGIAGSRLESVGFGKQYPIIARDTTLNAAAVNRRVEIRILER
ncbi:MAG: OmpA family protein [Sphingobacteriales bacterium]|nr:MAG: OmpA family protein [Sphingobacteriales bacterium]